MAERVGLVGCNHWRDAGQRLGPLTIAEVRRAQRRTQHPITGQVSTSAGVGEYVWPTGVNSLVKSRVVVQVGVGVLSVEGPSCEAS